MSNHNSSHSKILDKTSLPTVMISLQECIENLIRRRKTESTFQVLISLLRKYLPRDFYFQVEKEIVVILKTLSYLFKLIIDRKEKTLTSINPNIVLKEINGLFLLYPPSNLQEGVANLDLLDKIYRQLRQVTDFIVELSPNSCKDFLEKMKSKPRSEICFEFFQYLTTAIKN